MGWLISIYMLDNIWKITILKFLSIGITHPSSKKSIGFFIEIWKINFQLIIGINKLIKFKEVGNA